MENDINKRVPHGAGLKFSLDNLLKKQIMLRQNSPVRLQI